MAGSTDPLDELWPFFDIAEAPLGPFGHICEVRPNDLAYARWPRFPAAARPEAGRVATGRGLDAASSRRSGLGEAIELASVAVWGDERVVVATISELGNEAIPPSALTGFSASQRLNRESWNRRLSGFDRIPGADDPFKPIKWVEAQCLNTGNKRLVPAHLVFLGYGDPFDNTAVDVADTNGCACGASIEIAIRAAVMEIVERDATARWWYGRLVRPNIASEALASLPEFLSYISSRRRQLRVFDISSDLAIPVAAAVSFEPDGTKVALGFAANETIQEAALSATTEMLAMETQFYPFRSVEHDRLTIEWLKWTNALEMQHVCGIEATTTCCSNRAINCSKNIGELIGGMQNVRIFSIDTTRSEIGVPSVKVLSPELCHYKPRFGKRRLYGSGSKSYKSIHSAFTVDHERLLLI